MTLKLDSKLDVVNNICIKKNDTYIVIPIYDILYCKAVGSYTLVHLRDNRILLHTTLLKKVESILPKQSFIRCHNSYLINLSEVKAFNKKEKAVFINGVEIPISRRQYKEVILRLVK